MRKIVLAGISVAALALGGCSWFHSDRSEARNTASPWDSDATRARQAAELHLDASSPSQARVAAGSTASDRRSGSTAGNAAGMSRDQVMRVQQELKAAGLYQGKIDGIAGPQTKRALAAFQQAHGLPPTGTLDQQTAALLEGSQSTGAGTSASPPSSTQPGTSRGMSSAPSNAPPGTSGTGGAAPGGQR